MTPHQGSGAGQAIEDAYILGTLLAHPLTTLSTVKTALKAYEAICLPLGIDIQRRSWLNGKLYEFADPRFASLDLDCDIRKGTEQREMVMERLKAVGRAVVENREWAWTTNIEDDRERAIALFEKWIRDQFHGDLLGATREI